MTDNIDMASRSDAAPTWSMALPDPTTVEPPGGNPVHELIIIGAGFGVAIQ